MPTTNHKRQNPASRGSSNEPATSPDQPVPAPETPDAPPAPQQQRRKRKPPRRHSPHRPCRAAKDSRPRRRTRRASRTSRAAVAPRRRAQHRRTEGNEHPEAHADRQGAQRGRRHRHAQAGADFPDSEGADRAERIHLLGRRARSAAGRIRIPARARLQLPARPRRHLRVAVADSEVRPPDRRHGVGTDSAAEGRRALLRADQSRSGQLRAARAGARQAVLRKPHAAVSAGAAEAGNGARKIYRRASWICGRRSAKDSAA